MDGHLRDLIAAARLEAALLGALVALGWLTLHRLDQIEARQRAAARSLRWLTLTRRQRRAIERCGREVPRPHPGVERPPP